MTNRVNTPPSINKIFPRGIITRDWKWKGCVCDASWTLSSNHCVGFSDRTTMFAIKWTYWFSTHWFRLCDLLRGQNSVAETKDWPFLYHLDGLGQTFRVRLVMRLKYKDGHETHYACGRPLSQKFSRPVQTKWFVAAVYRRNRLLQPVTDLFRRSDLSPRRVAATCRLVCSDL